MSAKTFLLGIIGADPSGSRAGASHIPALHVQPSLTLAAEATPREEPRIRQPRPSERSRWFADPYALIRDENIDPVPVAVTMPAHRPLVPAAGQAAYCESPLGTTELVASVRIGRLLSARVGAMAFGSGPQSPSAYGFLSKAAAAGFWAAASINVGEVYAALACDLANGTYATPGFAHALHHSPLIAAVERAAQAGGRGSSVDDTATADR